jgi:uncharacterized protein YybS (DUF2232 family)
MNNSTKSMVESAILVGMAFVMTFMATYIPFLSFFLFLIATPFAVIGTRHDLKYSVISVIASTILVSILISPFQGIFVGLYGGLQGATIGYSLRKLHSPYKTMLMGMLSGVISLVGLFALAFAMDGIGIIEILDQLKVQMLSFYEKMGMTDDTLLTQLAETFTLVKKLIPSSVILASLLYTFINYIVSTKILTRLKVKLPQKEKFTDFKLPSNFMFGSLIILILTVIVSYMKIVDSEVLQINIINLFIYVFFIQGLAVVLKFVERSSKAIKALIVFGVFILSLLPFVALLGWLDIIFNFRKMKVE